MDRGPVWAAVDDMSDAWRRTSPVETFIAPLPRNEFMDQVTQGPRGGSGLPRDPVAEGLTHVNAGLSVLMANPFLLPSLLPMAAAVTPELNLNALHQANPAWFDAASRVEAAHRLTLEWLRSRLPRYPLIPAPQLARNTPLTTREYTQRIVWTPRATTTTLQFEDVPNEIHMLLQADGELARSIAATTRNVHAALEDTPEWVRLVDADRALTPTARAELMACRRRVNARLTDTAQDAHEPSNAMRRDQFRSAVTRDEVRSLTGVAGEYAQAFAGVDTSIEFAAGTVFSQLTCYPTLTLAVSELSIEPGPFTRVRFSSAGNMAIFPLYGSVVWLDDPLVNDAVYLEAEAVAFGPYGVTANLTGIILDGSRSLHP